METAAGRKEPSLKPVTPEMLELFEKPTIASQLPIVFDNGHIFARFEGGCTVCRAPVDAEDIHGVITRPFPRVAIVQAIGACRSCKIYVPFFMRYKDDGRTETRDAAGNWIFGHSEREGGRASRWAAETMWALALAIAVLGSLVALVAR
ncbi:hypothetical protein [Geomonas subterranea]|uniref:hypothetical protein n=1 Tax=Geomonas subterranea TaxID=2847989 RepID=UPI001CD59928|nr:hypothetical protein [Geomonas fuzhouensis]